MTVRDLLDDLDGRGLVITDYEDLEVALDRWGLTLDTRITEEVAK